MNRSSTLVKRLQNFPLFSRYYSLFPRLLSPPAPEIPGQFTLKGLHRPNDWPRIATACLDDCLGLADQIRLHEPRRDASVLQLFDDLSDRLCSVLDVAELCRNVHPHPDFVVAAHEAFVHVSSAVQELNADQTLYQPLRQLYEDNEMAKKGDGGFLSCEENVMVRSLKHDFERGGITLGRSEKRRLLSLQERVAELGEEFVEVKGSGPPILEIAESKLRLLPENVRRRFGRAQTVGCLRVPVDGPMSHLLLKWVPDSRTREQVYRLTHGHYSKEKLGVLGELIGCRHEVAKLLGHGSYADLLFSDRLASSPDQVLEFLEKLSRVVAGAAQKERSSIEMEKMRREPYVAQSGRVGVHGWDRSFYIGRLKAQSFDLSSMEVSNYLPLSACIQGLADIVQELFGVKLTKVQPSFEEIWHEDVEKVQLADECGEVLGHIFLDLHPREGKYGHAAHFSIRCGRQPCDTVDYQTPIVALVCNFGKSLPSGDRLLTISEYETLFHEFGHSLHSLLSKTKFQHLSGTRVATDFVEVPSHLFEHFAWDPRIVSRFARHYRTGDPMPTRLVRSFCASRNGFIATEIQMQLLFSAMDLHFHGTNPPRESLVNTFEKLQKDLTSYLPDAGVPVPATFHHFVGYGGGYYSYMFARVISAQLWSSMFQKNPLSRESGVKLRHGILAYGGARSPADLIQNALQHDASCDPFLRSTGINPEDLQAGLKLPLSKLR